jgi:hypothetical protein
MTNVKIQMTNQIQMFKCLNDSGKKSDQRWGLLCRPLGRPVSLQKAAFPPEILEKLVQFEDAMLKSLWQFSLVHSTKDHHRTKHEVFGFFNVKPITFLDFGL